MMSFETGDHVARRAILGILHQGIVDARGGQVRVIHADVTRGLVVDDSLEDFAQGQAVTLIARAPAGAGAAIADNARAQLGQPFRLATANCEHLCHGARAGAAYSPTLERAVGWLPAAGAALLLAGGAVAALAGRPAPPRPMRLVCRPGTALPDVIAEVAPAVCYLAIKLRRGTATGSGFLVAPDVVMTNDHVVEDAIGSPLVRLADGRLVPGIVAHRAPRLDLALVVIPKQPRRPLSFAPFGDVRVGEAVFAIGAPRGLELSVTTGVVSALHRGDLGIPACDVDFVQIDAAIAPGSSGCPVLNMCGQVIGVAARGGDPGINFAIPSNQAAPVLGARKRRA